jgi:hypothetical protein
MSRDDATRAGIDAFLHELGRRFRGRGSLYLVGGSMLVYQGFRPRTLDIHYRIELTEGDDTQFIQALRAAQRVVNLHVEPASPADFIPLPAGWRERSRFLVQEGGLAVHAFDPLSTALAKIERGQERDIDDVLALCSTGVLTVETIVQAFEEIAPRIETEALPRITEQDFRRKVAAFAVRAQARLGPKP